MQEIPDYQQRYIFLKRRIENNSEAKSELEQLLFPTRHGKFPENFVSAGHYSRELGAKLYEMGFEEKLGPLEDVLKTYVAYGWMKHEYGHALAEALRFASRRRRFQRVSPLQKFVNFFMFPLDIFVAAGALTDDDWLALQIYAGQRFKDKDSDKPMLKLRS